MRIAPLLLCATLLAACGSSNDNNLTPDSGTRQLNLTVTRSGNGTGSVSSAPSGIACGSTCDALFPESTQVTLTAAPSADSTFAGWTGDCANATGPCTVTMDSAKTVNAVFTLTTEPLTVTVAGNGDGTVTSDPAGVSCSQGNSPCSAAFSVGATVTLTAAPNGTSAFAGWSGDCSGTSATCTVTADAIHNVTATFTATVTYALNVTVSGSGSVSASQGGGISNCTSASGTCSATYASGTSVTLAATADSGNVFSGWSGAGCSGTGACTVTMSQVQNVTATFSASNGPAVSSVSPNNGLATGTTPGVVVTGARFAAGDTVHFGSQTATCTVDSSTQLTCSVPSNGGTAATVDVTVSDGTSTGTLPNGWTYTGVENGQSGQPGWCSTQWPDTLTNTSGDAASATIYGQVYISQITPNDGSGILASVGYGPQGSDPSTDASWRFQASPFDSAQGNNDQFATTLPVPTVASTTTYSYAYRFSTDNGVNWTYCSLNSAGGTASGAAVDATKLGTWTVSAGATTQYALNVTVSGTGQVDSSPSGITACTSSGGTCSANYDSGTSVTLTATPSGSAAFTGWNGAGCSGTGTCTVSMTQAQNVTATFAVPQYALTVTVTGNGSVSADSGAVSGCTSSGGTCTGDYDSGTNVTLTATPASASDTFSGWTGGGCSGTGTCTVAMTQAQNVTAAFSSAATFQVTSIAPADASSNVSNNTTVVLTFNNNVDATSLTTTSGCTDAIEVATSTAFSSCRSMTAAVSNNQVTLTFASPLNPGSTYYVRVRGAGATSPLKDTSGNTLSADYVSGGFAVASTWAVTALNPTTNATGVSPNTTVSITFNRAADDTTITTNATTGTCTGSVQLFSTAATTTCIGLTKSATNGGLTYVFTPVSALTAGATYRVKITPDARDTGGNSFANNTYPYGTSSTGGFTIAAANVADVTGLAVSSVTLQGATLGWTAASGADHYEVSYEAQGGSTFTTASSSVTGTSYTVAGLLPDQQYTFKVVTVDASSNKSSGVTTTGTTAFSGTVADFTANQKVTGLGGRDFYFTWNAGSFYAAIEKGTQTTAVDGTNQDAMVVALDTDASGDANGTAVLTGVDCSSNVAYGQNCYGTTDTILPFQADVAVQLQNQGGTAAVSVWTSSSGTWSTLATATSNVAADGSFAEMKLASADLGSPAQARLVFTALNPTSGYTFDLAPKSATGGTDVTGDFASLTSGLDVGTNLFDTTKTAISASGATQFDAPSLVSLSVDATAATLPGTQPGIFGDHHPLLYRDGFTSYTLTQSGGVYSGKFNFGQATGALYFEFTDGQDNAETNFGGGKDRVYTLSGGTETLPVLTWGTSYSATHVVSLTFTVSTGGTPTNITGALPELGSFGCGSGNEGLALTDTGTADSNGELWTATTSVTNHDFNGSPVNFKTLYGGCNYEGGGDHYIHSDVINSLSMKFNAGDGTSF